jgi:hypothetical protein
MKNQVEKIVEQLKNSKDYVLVDVNNIYCSENGFDDDEIYSNDVDFLNTYFTDVDQAVRAVCYGEYKYMDEWVRFNGYGNLETLNYFTTNDLVESVETIAEYIFENQEGFEHILDLEFDDEEIEIHREFEGYSLCQRGNFYYIDNGDDDVSNEFYMVKFFELIKLNDEEFLLKCKEYFN